MAGIREITYLEAFRGNSTTEMRPDEKMLLIDEDIATYAAALGVALAMIDDFALEWRPSPSSGALWR